MSIRRATLRTSAPFPWAVAQIVAAVAVGAMAACDAPPPPRAPASTCHVTLELPHLMQRGPTCAAAAAVMAARAFPGALQLEDVARQIRVWKDGVSYFDIAEVLARHGYESLVFQGNPELAARILAAHIPVVAAVDLHGGKHALTLSGVQATALTVGCSAPLEFSALDPRGGPPLTLSRDAFAAMQWAEQLFITYPRTSTARVHLAAAGVDLPDLARQDRRFRSRELLLRAREHAHPNPDMLSLLERAVTLDPDHAEARRLRDEVARTLLQAAPR